MVRHPAARRVLLVVVMMVFRLFFLVALFGALWAWPAAAAGPFVVVDNSAKEVVKQGQWSQGATTPGYFGSGYDFRVAGDGANSVYWPFAGTEEGDYEVYVRWTAGPNRASNATYTIKHDYGQSSVQVNQQSGGGSWHRLGKYRFRLGPGQGVILTDKANGVVIADAVLYAKPGTKPESFPASSEPISSSGTGSVTPTPTPASSASSPPPPPPPTPTVDKNDPRYFAETRYAIGNDRFWDYFQKRGGVRTFGYPVSNVFTFKGLQVQVFQRQVMQLSPDGGVALLNLLDSGLMPYTRINGSTFPAPDPEVIKLHPSVQDPNYFAKALEFVKEFSPDTWQGLPVNFYQTFASTVRLEEAFPDGQGDPNLLPGFNLEIWGLPTSRPAFDPKNKGFVYLRFQRGIMHYDDACKCTQALLLADYFKSLLMGRNVPADLQEEAKTSPLFGQYNSQKPLGLNRPDQLPGSDLRGAFRRDPTVLVDAGHGGAEIGTSHIFPDGTRLAEKDLNLRVARKVAALLREAGFNVVETRTADTGVNVPPRDLTGDDKITISDDLQARVDRANDSGSDVLLSIHFNGVSNPDIRGTYVFYNGDREFSSRSRDFAEMTQRRLVAELRAAGYETLDRGVRTDESVLGQGYYYYLLGPKSDVIVRPSRMPGIIGEALFLTNPNDANALRQERIIDAIAKAYADAVKEYFAKYEAN